jgi:hypothetical protein
MTIKAPRCFFPSLFLFLFLCAAARRSELFKSPLSVAFSFLFGCLVRSLLSAFKEDRSASSLFQRDKETASLRVVACPSLSLPNSQSWDMDSGLLEKGEKRAKRGENRLVLAFPSHYTPLAFISLVLNVSFFLTPLCFPTAI